MKNLNYFNGKNVLVTGGQGFIGRALVRRLRELGATAVSLDLNNVDICDSDKLLKFKRGVRFHLVYHLASVNYVPFSWANPQLTYKINLLGTVNVLEFCRLRQAGKMVFMSSYVYGKPKYLPVDERHPISPSNPYSRSKYLGEKLCESYVKDYGLNCVILRPFNVYGIGQREDFLIPTMISQIRKSGQMVLQDLAPRRDFLYLDDMIEALLAAASSQTAPGEVFNLGFGESYSVKMVADLLLKVAGEKARIISKKKKRRDEIADVVANTKKARTKLKWKPRVSFEDGLKRIWQNG